MKLEPATCKCGHKGKSKQPDTYQCSHCYYTAQAKWNVTHSMKLRKRADKLTLEAARFTIKAAAFKEKHSDVGSIQQGES